MKKIKADRKEIMNDRRSWGWETVLYSMARESLSAHVVLRQRTEECGHLKEETSRQREEQAQ